MSAPNFPLSEQSWRRISGHISSFRKIYCQ